MNYVKEPVFYFSDNSYFLYNTRKRKGYKQIDIAKQLNMSSMNYCKIEKGISGISYNNLIRLIEILDLDNLVTLCHKCHLNLPEHRKKMVIGLSKFFHT